MDATTRDADVTLVLELGRVLQRHGIPSRRIEEILVQAGLRLGVHVEVFATVTALIVRFGEARELRTTFLRLQPAEVNLGVLRQLDRIVHSFVEGTSSTNEVRRALAQLETHDARPRLWARICIAGSGGAAWCTLLGGAAPELSCAAFASSAIEGLSALVERRRSFEREFVAIAGLIAGASASSAAALLGPLGPFNRQTAIIAALIPLLPGFSFVTAAEELASQDLLTGSARMISAVLVFAQLIFGVAMGSEIELLWRSGAHAAVTPGHELALWIQLLVLLPAIAALALRLRADVRDLGICYAAGLVGFCLGRAASLLMGVELGAFVGALGVGVLGNASARWREGSALLTIIPGVLVLVPGSLGMRSASALWTAQPLEGLRHGFSTLFVAVAIATGLIVANSVVPPRRAL